MALKIKASSFVEQCVLEIRRSGVRYRKTAFTGGVRDFTFAQIDAILMSPSHVLSFQVGKEVFSVQTKPKDRKHREVIDALLREVQRAHVEALGAPSPEVR